MGINLKYFNKAIKIYCGDYKIHVRSLAKKTIRERNQTMFHENLIN